MTIGTPALPREPLLEPVNAAPIPGTTVEACFGFTPVNGYSAPQTQQCPANHALFWVGGDAGRHKDGRTVNVGGTCCPLPSKDILQDAHVFVGEECPEDHVATGARVVPCKDEVCPVLMRCTKINAARYQLGESTPSYYWGNGHAGWRNSQRIEWEEIPLSLRYAVGRESNDRHGIDGCVGYPWGSLFTKKTSKHCGGNFFRQLQFKGAPGDPAAGVAVKLLPECDSVEFPHDPARAACRKAAGIANG